jgi:hypothetical protein
MRLLAGNYEGEYLMKKFYIIGAIVSVVLLALGTAGMIYARVQTPAGANTDLKTGVNQPKQGNDLNPGNRNRGNIGPGNLGKNWNEGTGPGMMGQGRGLQSNLGPGLMGSTAGKLQQYMLNALAEKLNLTPADLQTRMTNGETPYKIAQSQGLTDTQISDLFLAARDAALTQAVTDGVLTQEQANTLSQHMGQMWFNGFGFGFGFGNHPRGNMPGQKP